MHRISASEYQISNYAESHTSSEPTILQHLIRETYDTMRSAHMLCGRVEGRLLKMLTSLCKAELAVELGCFTGYSALSIAEALPSHGKIITCDLDTKATEIAKKYFSRSPHGYKIEHRLQPALDIIDELENNTVDLAFIDADKKNYPLYFKNLLNKVKSGGLMIFDNALYSGKAITQENQQGTMIHETNVLIDQCEAVENVFLTDRDGINVVRKL